jgi:hypothetical protein
MPKRGALQGPLPYPCETERTGPVQRQYAEVVLH